MINKIDKPGANLRTCYRWWLSMESFQQHGVGDEWVVEISAKFGQNIGELLETVLLVAEVEELKADPSVRARYR